LLFLYVQNYAIIDDDDDDDNFNTDCYRQLVTTITDLSTRTYRTFRFMCSPILVFVILVNSQNSAVFGLLLANKIFSVVLCHVITQNAPKCVQVGVYDNGVHYPGASIPQYPWRHSPNSPLLFPPLPSLFLPPFFSFLFLPFLSPFPLEVGPLNPARGSGERCIKLPQQGL